MDRQGASRRTGVQPAGAVRDALDRDGRLKAADLDLFEINEAFAGVALASVRELDIPVDRVNVNGERSRSDTRSA
jgi:acetyl-CoA C-acetyltransferase